jgi:formylglycine-generating enzyme required for sulfatase activity
LNRLGQDKTAVFPILVMNASMPSPLELPESLRQLTFQNAISIRNDPDFNHDIERLIRDIRRSQGKVQQTISVQYFESETLYIPEGLFWMGSSDGLGIPYYETPQHEVFLPAYRIGKYPVTNLQYEEFIRQTGTLVAPNLGWNGQRVPFGSENYPVTGVTWYEALAYCQWLSEKTGRKYSLPNEAQWEKACRAGNKSSYPWGNEYDPERCNHGRSSIAQVDAFPAQNEYGCFDLVGNVRQWTCTLWGEKRVNPNIKYIYPWKNDARNDLNANRQVRRVVRGSTMKDDLNFLRCTVRHGQAPDDAGLPGARTGFRVVMAV